MAMPAQRKAVAGPAAQAVPAAPAGLAAQPAQAEREVARSTRGRPKTAARAAALQWTAASVADRNPMEEPEADSASGTSTIARQARIFSSILRAWGPTRS